MSAAYLRRVEPTFELVLSGPKLDQRGDRWAGADSELSGDWFGGVLVIEMLRTEFNENAAVSH